jgi:UDP-N-acetylmuramate dehydrogenase
MSTPELAALVEELREAGFPVETMRPLATLTTYAVGGAAAAALTISDPSHVRALAAVTARHPEVPMAVIGRGSNTLIADSGYDGLVVVVTAPANAATIDVDGDDVVVAASVTMPVLARRSAKAGRGGLEWCVGIPGSVGGAVRMNAGGHGAEMIDSLRSVEIVSLRSGNSVVVKASDLGLHFRGSAIAPHHVVVSARLQTVDCDVAQGQKEIDSVVAWRREHQPGGRNAGSVFVNPAPGEGSAGALIDACGLRGFNVGAASVSEKHANFIQASDGATAADVLAVMTHVQEVVNVQHGVLLRSEVCLLGFDENVAQQFSDPRHRDEDRVTASRQLALLMGDAHE